MQTPSLCLNSLVFILVAAAAEMHWELNHCFLPFCFVGPAELCAGVRLPLDKNTWIQCEIGPANSALLWMWAAGYVCYSAQSRAQGGSREGWQLFSFAIPAMSCRSLSHREHEWELGKEDRCNFLTPSGEARAGCQMARKTSCCVVCFLESLEKAISFLSLWEGAWSKRLKKFKNSN